MQEDKELELLYADDVEKLLREKINCFKFE